MDSQITTAVAVANVAFVALIVWGVLQRFNHGKKLKAGFWVPTLLFGLLSFYSSAYLAMLRIQAVSNHRLGEIYITHEISYGLADARFLDDHQAMLKSVFTPAHFIHRRLCPGL